ncbi:hypothetical protein [Microbacterium sp. R86528]|uniref:hypothetical protein n=1 Tax=Microbacterium sp. R86528 TaxID=3093864 RepID=UPI0037CABBF2
MTPPDLSNDAPTEVSVGHLSREELLAGLKASGTQLNEHAKTLLAASPFDDVYEGEVISIAERSLTDLGLTSGASLTQIYSRAKSQRLRLCPAVAGPYLRLALAQQHSAPDSVLSSGRAPIADLQRESALGATGCDRTTRLSVSRCA